MPSLIIPAGAPLIAGPEQSRWANADWERLPNDSTRYEIIDGMLYLTTAPGTFHERLTVAFMQYVGIPAIERGPACPSTPPSTRWRARSVTPGSFSVVAANWWPRRRAPIASSSIAGPPSGSRSLACSRARPTRPAER
jgi:hypothetical protein